MSSINNDESVKLSSRATGSITVALGAIAFFAIYFFIYHLQTMNKSAAALGMPDMGMKDLHKFWAFPVLQASGLLGMVTAFISVFFGLQQSRKSTGWFKLSYRMIDQLHRQVALLTLFLVLLHAFTTAYDAMGDSWRTVLWFNGWANPKTGWPQAVWGYNLGIIGFYSILLLGPTFYLRRKIGVSRWKFLHRFILIFYVASVWHALILGMDIGYYKWIQPIIWLAQVPLLWLLSRRFIELAKKHSSKKISAGYLVSTSIVWVSYLGIFACLIIVLTGHSAFIKTI